MKRTRLADSILPRHVYIPATERMPRWVDSKGELLVAAESGRPPEGRIEFEPIRGT